MLDIDDVAAGSELAKKELADIRRALLATQQVLLDVFRVHYAPELFKEAHVRESKKRIADNGGTLAYVAEYLPGVEGRKKK